MKKLILLYLTSVILSTLLVSCKKTFPVSENPKLNAAHDVLERVLGKQNASRFVFKYQKKDTLDTFSISVNNNQVVVTGNSPIALTHGAYLYIKHNGYGMFCWSGLRIPAARPW